MMITGASVEMVIAGRGPILVIRRDALAAPLHRNRPFSHTHCLCVCVSLHTHTVCVYVCLSLPHTLPVCKRLFLSICFVLSQSPFLLVVLRMCLCIRLNFLFVPLPFHLQNHNPSGLLQFQVVVVLTSVFSSLSYPLLTLPTLYPICLRVLPLP